MHAPNPAPHATSGRLLAAVFDRPTMKLMMTCMLPTSRMMKPAKADCRPTGKFPLGTKPSTFSSMPTWPRVLTIPTAAATATEDVVAVGEAGNLNKLEARTTKSETSTKRKKPTRHTLGGFLNFLLGICFVLRI